MKNKTFVPASANDAEMILNSALFTAPDKLPHPEFVRAWSSLAYLNPGLHPDGFNDKDSGWPKRLKPLAMEAWRRADAEEITEEELYPSDAQWAGMYDRMHTHTEEESKRRAKLSALSAC